MKQGSFKLSTQIDNYAFYGYIELTCIVKDDFSRELNLLVPDEFKRWQNGVTFGAQYFLEHVIPSVGLTVEITNMDFHDVDSNNTIFAYVAFNALVNATHLPVKSEITFDKENKSFIFPK